MKKLFVVTAISFHDNEIFNTWITHDSEVAALLFWLESNEWMYIPDVDGLSKNEALSCLYEYAFNSDWVLLVEKVPECYDNTNVSVYSV
jgi:hypothetical protein